MKPPLSIEFLSRESGLPTQQIHSICYSDNFLWVATSNGLARFDGSEVSVYAQDEGLLTHGLRHIRAFNHLLLVCSDLGLDIFDLQTERVVAQINTVELGMGWCECAVAIDEKNFALGCGSGLLLFDFESKKTSFVDAVGNQPVNHLVCIEHSGLLVGSSGQKFVWGYDCQDQSLINLQHLNQQNRCRCFIQHNRNIWVVENNQILKLDEQAQLIQSIYLPESIEPPLCILPVGAERLMIIDNNALHLGRVIDSKLEVELEQSIKVTVNDIVCDDIGNFWLATDSSGLLKIPVLQNMVELKSNYENQSILSLSSSDLDGPILVAGASSSFVFLNEELTEIKSLRDVCVWDLQQHSSGKIWAATNSGLSCLDHIEQPQLQTFSDGHLGAGRCLMFLPEGILYGTTCGLFLFHFERQSFTQILDTGNNQIGYVYSIRQLDQSIYITTLGNGIWEYQSDTSSIQPLTLGRQLKNVYDIDANPDKDWVIAADNCILLLRNNNVSVIHQSQQAVAAWSCRWYSDSQVLIGSSEGLKLICVSTGSVDFLIKRFPKEVYWEFTTSRSLLPRQAGQYWCGTNDGVYSVDISQLISKVEPPLPELRSVTCTKEYRQTSSYLEVSEGNWQLTLILGCRWFWLVRDIEFEYRLRGFDKTWLKLDGQRLTLTSLPPGEYGLEVRLKNSLTRSAQLYPLCLIRVIARNPLVQFGLQFVSVFKGVLNYLLNIKDVWDLERSYLKLEKLVKFRTEELEAANQALALANTELESISHTDQLTQLNNRHAFVEKFSVLLSHAVREQQSISLLMIDIDFFKTFNDNYGHLEGDKCLREVAQCLKEQVKRNSDLLARFGGEEFIVALPNVSLEDALSFANGCVKAVREANIKHKFSDIAPNVTISVGVCCLTPTRGLDPSSYEGFLKQLIELADKNLYRAKHMGRNQAVADFSQTE